MLKDKKRPMRNLSLWICILFSYTLIVGIVNRLKSAEQQKHLLSNVPALVMEAYHLQQDSLLATVASLKSASTDEQKVKTLQPKVTKHSKQMTMLYAYIIEEGASETFKEVVASHGTIVESGISADMLLAAVEKLDDKGSDFTIGSSDVITNMSIFDALRKEIWGINTALSVDENAESLREAKIKLEGVRLILGYYTPFIKDRDLSIQLEQQLNGISHAISGGNSIKVTFTQIQSLLTTLEEVRIAVGVKPSEAKTSTVQSEYNKKGREHSSKLPYLPSALSYSCGSSL
ncbi:hypothetical protein V6R21_06550 [Limibacter armeniacum]|uniref:hypothetical protein n=1 Tax=Limibacter armeniacum TaxID=466084 RepID=UPI002FE6C2D9